MRQKSYNFASVSINVIMKRLHILLSVPAIALYAAAQQLPNVGFEGEWTKSYPWNSVYNELSFADAIQAMIDNGMEIAPTDGLQPDGWIASNVLGVVTQNDEGGYSAIGSTEIITRVDGHESATAVHLKSNPNPFMASQIVPAYLSLGKTWATNGLDFATFTPVNKDGGAFGGIAFTARPDALTFFYKRAHGEDNPQEKASVVVYSWKGSWLQADVPANNTMMESQIVKVDMVDRDRNILGMETAQGGAVTKSDDAELIGRLIYDIEGDASDWTLFEQPLEYLSDATPEKINVIISANDYFNSDAIGNANELTVDDVKFLYFSRLKSLKAGDKEVSLENDKYDYIVNAPFPASADEIMFETLGQSAQANVELNAAASTATVTVSNIGADRDGEMSHTYTLTFAAEQQADKYDGTVTIELFGSDITEGGQAATLEIISTGANTCTMRLPNFTLSSLSPDPIGDIVVPDVSINGDTYTGSVSGMKLMDGAIDADVELSGTINAAGEANFTINVLWNNQGAQIPILVKFNGSKVTGSVEVVTADENTQTEYYSLSGLRVSADALTPGIYIRRQGKNVSKVIVK